MAYINVDEVYILDNTGLQVDKTTDLPFKDASLSETEKAQARANIGAGGSNPNLLDNPFFQVNQRSYTNESTASAYVADRWFLYGAPSLTVTNSGNGIVLTGSGDARLRHHIDERFFMGLYGEPLTFSIKVDGKVYSFTFNNLASRPSAQTGICPDTWIYTEAGRILVSCAWQPITNVILLFFRAYAPMTIQAVKLEHGSVSTLANDAPPNYAEELAKCQRYFYRISNTINYAVFGTGHAASASVVYVFVPLPVTMRNTPAKAISTVGDFRLIGNGQSVSMTDIGVRYATPNGVTLQTSGSSGLTTYQTYSLVNTGTSAYIDFSADL